MAGKTLLADLRHERAALGADGRDTIVLRGADGDVCVQRHLACTVSGVLKSALSGPYVESATGSYELRDHAAATITFALDFLLGDESCCIDGQNGLALLALADQLGLSPLKEACEAALLGMLVTSNAAEIADAAARFGCNDLLQAARAICDAENSALGALMVRKRALLSDRARSVKAREDAERDTKGFDAKLRDVMDQQAHELEQIFRAAAAASPVTGARKSKDPNAYPRSERSATEVVRVSPNVNQPIGWTWDREPRAPREASSPQAATKKRKRGQRGTPPHVPTFNSIMEAYDAVKPGGVIKLCGGRHIISGLTSDGAATWDGLNLRKSVQIVADDGLARERVFIGTMAAIPSCLSSMLHIFADVRFARITLLCTADLSCLTNFFGVHTDGRLWLEDCELKLAGGPSMMAGGLQAADSNDLVHCRIGIGIDVKEGASAVIRRCVLADAEGPAVQINPNAKSVFIERSVVSGCGHIRVGTTYSGRRFRPGERGAIEILFSDEVWTNYGVNVGVKVELRSCHVEGNVGPGMSYRFRNRVGHARVGYNGLGRALVGSFCHACDRAFSVVRCIVKGNAAREDKKLPHGEDLQPTELRDSVAVFNAAVRGDMDYEVLHSHTDNDSDEYDDLYDEPDEFDDDDADDDDDDDESSDDEDGDLDDEDDDDDDESDDDDGDLDDEDDESDESYDW